MAGTIQKTTIRRYNGTSWDTLHFATSGDITAHGYEASVKEDLVGFAFDDVIQTNDSVSALLDKVINRLATIDKRVIPTLTSGSAIKELDAAKLTGEISRDNLPKDIGGAGIPVDSEEAKNELTADDVRIGDIVKVIGGASYLVTAVDPDAAEGEPQVTYMGLTDGSSSILWSRVTGTPTTLAGYGITDAVKNTDTVDHGTKTDSDPDDYSAAGKVVKANATGKLDFSITGDAATVGGKSVSDLATAEALSQTNTNVQANAANITALQSEIKSLDASNIKTGTLPLSVIPKGALEQMYVAADEDALATLTTEQVQNGDTVKIADKEVDGKTVVGMMYYVADETKLGTEDYLDAFMPYTAGTASSVNWSGVLGTPTTLAGYGITDAVTTDMVSDTAVAGKLLKLNADGKLPADITGDAATVGGKSVSDLATAESLAATDKKATDNAAAITELQGIVGIGSGGDTPSITDRVDTLETTIGDATSEGSVVYTIEQLKSGAAIKELATSKLKGIIDRKNLPSNIGGLTHDVDSVPSADLTADNAYIGDLVKTADGKIYSIVDNTKLDVEDGYKLLVNVSGSDIQWTQIKGAPTTLAGYGITDAVKNTDIITDGLNTEADIGGKLVKLDIDKKLHVNIAGDAATLEGHDAAYFATKAEHDALAVRVPLLLNSEADLDTITNPSVGQMVIVPISGT